MNCNDRRAPHFQPPDYFYKFSPGRALGSGARARHGKAFRAATARLRRVGLSARRQLDPGEKCRNNFLLEQGDRGIQLRQPSLCRAGGRREKRRHLHRRISFCAAQLAPEHLRCQQRGHRGEFFLERREQLRQRQQHLPRAHAGLGRHQRDGRRRLHGYANVAMGQPVVQHRFQSCARERRDPQAHRLYRRLVFTAEQHLSRA